MCKPSKLDLFAGNLCRQKRAADTILKLPQTADCEGAVIDLFVCVPPGGVWLNPSKLLPHYRHSRQTDPHSNHFPLNHRQRRSAQQSSTDTERPHPHKASKDQKRMPRWQTGRNRLANLTKRLSGGIPSQSAKASDTLRPTHKLQPDAARSYLFRNKYHAPLTMLAESGYNTSQRQPSGHGARQRCWGFVKGLRCGVPKAPFY